MKELKAAKNNMLLGVGILLFAIFYYAETYRFQLVAVKNTVDAAFMPRVLAVLIAICALIIFLQGFLAYRKIPVEKRQSSSAEKARDKASMARCAICVVIMLVTAVLFKPLGFIPTMIPSIFAILCIVEKKEKRRYKLYAIISVLSPIILFFIFYYGFSTLLPAGILQPLLSYL